MIINFPEKNFFACKANRFTPFRKWYPNISNYNFRSSESKIICNNKTNIYTSQIKMNPYHLLKIHSRKAKWKHLFSDRRSSWNWQFPFANESVVCTAVCEEIIWRDIMPSLFHALLSVFSPCYCEIVQWRHYLPSARCTLQYNLLCF